MKEYEYKLLDSFFDELSDNMASNGCNDFQTPEKFTTEDYSDFIKDWKKFSKLEFGEEFEPIDFSVLQMLKVRILGCLKMNQEMNKL